jgi:hypothetical protein
VAGGGGRGRGAGAGGGRRVAGARAEVARGRGATTAAREVKPWPVICFGEERVMKRKG